MLRRNSNRKVSSQDVYTGLLIGCKTFGPYEGNCILVLSGEIAGPKLQVTVSYSILGILLHVQLFSKHFVSSIMFLFPTGRELKQKPPPKCTQPCNQ